MGRRLELIAVAEFQRGRIQVLITRRNQRAAVAVLMGVAIRVSQQRRVRVPHGAHAPVVLLDDGLQDGERLDLARRLQHFLMRSLK